VFTSERLSDVYALTVEVVVDPHTGTVRTQPRGRHHDRQEHR